MGTEYRSSDGFSKLYDTKDVVISSGASLSSVVDIEQMNITGFQIPAAWTSAKLTFQASYDGVTFGDLQDSSGNEIQVTVAAGKFVGVNLSEASGLRYLKVRSGTSGTPVNQGADRTISIVLTNNAEASAGGGGGGGAATIADGADVAQGAKADAAVTDATATATLLAFIKGLVKILFDVWDSTIHGLRFIARLDTTGGWTPFKVISAATTNATVVKASAGQLGGLQVFNNSGTIGYLKLYNKASAPTVGTDTPVKTLLIPANTSGAGFIVPRSQIGTQFSNGIALAITGGIADNDNTAVAANAFVVNGDYN